MADKRDERRLVRFDFPRGLDAAAIAQAIRENCRRILDEAAKQKQTPERDAGGGPAGDSGQAGRGADEGAASDRPGADT